MLASEIVYESLKTDFEDRVGPHPLAEPFELRDKPYVTYQKISSESLDDDGNWTGHDSVRMQVNVFHQDSIVCERSAIDVRWIMTEVQNYCACECVGSRSDYDPETQIYYEQIDFLMWQSVC